MKRSSENVLAGKKVFKNAVWEKDDDFQQKDKFSSYECLIKFASKQKNYIQKG